MRHTLALRLPDWCIQPQIILNGEEVEQDIRKGYLHITREWQEGDTLNLTLPMPVRRVYGNPLVRHVAGKVAIQRGPLVYCLEQADNGESLHNLWLPADAPFTTFEGNGLFRHKILIQAPGYRYEQSNPEQQPLWHYDSAPAKRQPQILTFIPWFSWANRGEGEMRIWVNEETSAIRRSDKALAPHPTHGAHCRMRRERFIRPTKACKFNILHELCRHDKTRKRRIRQ